MKNMKTENVYNTELIYDFYKGTDEYSDGDIEEELLNIVKNNRDYDKIINETDSFAVFYHLSKNREFITEVMDISKSDSVLEIGAGCGAITGALAREAKEVTCIDLSRRRSMINAYKNRENDNIKIYVGNYQDIKLDKNMM